jgi:hypothetical protein
MTYSIKNKLINLPVCLGLFFSGVLTILISQQGIDDTVSMIIYIAFGILFVLSGILLVASDANTGYVLTITTGTAYLVYFLVVITYMLKTDNTGQGLVGVMFLVPQAATSLIAVIFSIVRLRLNVSSQRQSGFNTDS